MLLSKNRELIEVRALAINGLDQRQATDLDPIVVGSDREIRRKGAGGEEVACLVVRRTTCAKAEDFRGEAVRSIEAHSSAEVQLREQGAEA